MWPEADPAALERLLLRYLEQGKNGSSSRDLLDVLKCCTG